jgi:hypothetical protein
MCVDKHYVSTGCVLPNATSAQCVSFQALRQHWMRVAKRYVSTGCVLPNATSALRLRCQTLRQH